MPGISQGIMRIRQRVTRWRLRGGLAFVIIVNLVPMDAVPVCDGERGTGHLKRFFLFLLVDAQRSL